MSPAVPGGAQGVAEATSADVVSFGSVKTNGPGKILKAGQAVGKRGRGKQTPPPPTGLERCLKYFGRH